MALCAAHAVYAHHEISIWHHGEPCKPYHAAYFVKFLSPGFPLFVSSCAADAFST